MGIDNLNNNARARHTTFMQGVLTQMGIKNNSGHTIKLLTRLGARRSLDGMIFDIGNGKVAKCIFVGRGAVSSMDMIRKEYDFTKRMSDAGLGPKVYSMTEFSLPASLLNLKNQSDSALWMNNNKVKNLAIAELRRSGKIPAAARSSGLKEQINRLILVNGYKRAFTFNLFQQWHKKVPNSNYNRVKTGAIIIMENLFKGPGVQTAMTLYDYVFKHKNPIPLKEVVSAMKKMHKLGIAHRDFHANNIMVQIKTDGSIRIVIIDFGRAKSHPENANMKFNINNLRLFAENARVPNVKINSVFARSSSHRAPAKSSSHHAPARSSSRNFVVQSGSVRERTSKGTFRTKLTIAELRYYAARKGINLTGAKLKKDILLRLVK